MKNMGVAGPDSSNEVAKSNALPTTYLLPNVSSTKSLPGKKRRKCISHKRITLEKQRSMEMEGCAQGHGLGSYRARTDSQHHLLSQHLKPVLLVASLLT